MYRTLLSIGSYTLGDRVGSRISNSLPLELTTVSISNLFRSLGGFKLEVQRLGYCAVLLVASARVNARAKV